MDEEMITISKVEYERLKARDEILSRLEAYGVDNWDGYCMAINDEEGWCE